METPKWSETIDLAAVSEVWGEVHNAQQQVVVLVHSKRTNRLVWCDCAPLLLQSGLCSLILVDLPGFGRNYPVTAAAAHPLNYGSFLDAVLRFWAVDRPVVVVGLAMGGFCALRFAVEYRSRVAGLVLLCSPGGLMTEAILKCKEAADVVKSSHPGLDDVYLGPAASQRATDGRNETIASFLTDTEHCMDGNCSDGLRRAFLFRQIARLNAREFACANYKQWMNEARFGADDVLPLRRPTRMEKGTDKGDNVATNKGIPSLVVAGECDSWWSPEAMKEVARLLGADFVLFPQCGHTPPMEVPEQLVQELRSFLERL